MGEGTEALSLNLKAYQWTRAALMQGRFQPGERLKLRELAAAYGMSVTPVREALMQLASESALCQSERRSFRVPVYGVKVFEEISQLRIVLERRAIVECVRRITPGDIAKLRQIDGEMDAARSEDRWTDVMIHNEHFHMTAYRVAEAPILLELIESLWLKFGPIANGLRGKERVDSFLRGRANLPHGKLLRALELGDADLAGAAVEHDIVTLRDRLLPYLGESDAD